MNLSALIDLFLKNANQLKFRNLFFLVTALFLIDLVIPDFIPFIDELILGLLAIILANWKKDRKENTEGNLIEGEVVDENETNK